jgi:hypothetical protein
VLNGPPFDKHTDLALWRAAWEWLKRFWDERVGELYWTDPLLFWGTLIGLSAVTAVLVWHVSYSVRIAWRAMQGRTSIEPLAAEPQIFADFTVADAALSRGDARSAIEQAFLALMTWARPQLRHLTPRQWVRAVGRELPEDQAQALTALLRVHERACYAGAMPELSEAQQALALARRAAGLGA